MCVHVDDFYDYSYQMGHYKLMVNINKNLQLDEVLHCILAGINNGIQVILNNFHLLDPSLLPCINALLRLRFFEM